MVIHPPTHPSLADQRVDFKGVCWSEDKTKLMMDDFGPRSRSDFSPEPNCRRTKFCLEQISLMFCKVKGDVGGIYGRGDPPVIALARSSHPYLCSLIPSQPHIKTFHNKSSDFSNYIRMLKPSSYLFNHLVVTFFAHSPLQLFFFSFRPQKHFRNTRKGSFDK